MFLLLFGISWIMHLFSRSLFLAFNSLLSPFREIGPLASHHKSVQAFTHHLNISLFFAIYINFLHNLCFPHGSLLFQSSFSHFLSDYNNTVNLSFISYLFFVSLFISRLLPLAAFSFIPSSCLYNSSVDLSFFGINTISSSRRLGGSLLDH